MSFRDHLISLSLLREGEQVLHNCSSHWLIHLKLPLMYVISLLLPFIALYALETWGVVSETSSLTVIWLLFFLYGLLMTCYFFVRTVNFEMGACVITNQRVLRFGYRGLSEMIEREILPQKIEDVKIVRKGVMGMFFDAADVLIHTSTNEVERLKNIIQSRRIQEVFSQLLSQAAQKAKVSESSSEKKSLDWIDDALGQSQGEVFDVEEHREDTIDQIGDVFRKKTDSSEI